MGCWVVTTCTIRIFKVVVKKKKVKKKRRRKR